MSNWRVQRFTGYAYPRDWRWLWLRRKTVTTWDTISVGALEINRSINAPSRVAFTLQDPLDNLWTRAYAAPMASDDFPDDMSDHPDHPDNIAEIRRSAERLAQTARLHLRDYDYALRQWQGSQKLSDALRRDEAKERSAYAEEEARLAQWVLDRLEADAAFAAEPERGPGPDARAVYDIVTFSSPPETRTSLRYSLRAKLTGLARDASKDYFSRAECEAFLDGWDARNTEDESL